MKERETTRQARGFKMTDKKKTIKAWAIVNKLSGYILWGKYGYFILMSKRAAEERRKEEGNKKNQKVIPVEIKLK